MAVSAEFNRGFWCAVQEMSAQGASKTLIEVVLRGAGFTYDECLSLMDEEDFESERLRVIVEEVFNA